MRGRKGSVLGRISVPGKVILFGEHAVVYGRPALAMAVNLTMRCQLTPSRKGTWTENGYVIGPRSSPYVIEAHRRAMGIFGKPPVNLNMDIDSEIPSASGMGSSAAVTVVTIASVLAAHHLEPGDLDINRDLKRKVALISHSVEGMVQGKASPVDTSTIVQGGGVLVSASREDGLEQLWSTKVGGNQWFVHSIPVPENLSVIVGYSGVKGKTDRMVDRVRHFVEKNSFGMEVIDDIEEITREGVKALSVGELSRMGELMKKNHDLLHILGVSHPELEKMIDIVSGHVYGAKLMGSGGGGSIIAVADKNGGERAAESLREKGYTAFNVSVSMNGLEIDLGRG